VRKIENVGVFLIFNEEILPLSPFFPKNRIAIGYFGFFLSIFFADFCVFFADLMD